MGTTEHCGDGPPRAVSPLSSRTIGPCSLDSLPSKSSRRFGAAGNGVGRTDATCLVVASPTSNAYSRAAFCLVAEGLEGRDHEGTARRQAPPTWSAQGDLCGDHRTLDCEALPGFGRLGIFTTGPPARRWGRTGGAKTPRRGVLPTGTGSSCDLPVGRDYWKHCASTVHAERSREL